MRGLLRLSLVLTACNSSPLTVNGNGDGSSNTSSDLAGSGPLPDLTMTTIHNPDLTNATCDQVNQAIGQFIDSHQSCVRDSDCSLLQTGCGLPAVCGGVIALDPSSPVLSSLFQTWQSLKCLGPCPPCALQRRTPQCQQGHCALIPTDQFRSPVGDGCADSTSCASTQCVMKPFEGGYCTLASCQDPRYICPAESDCLVEPLDQANYCLRRCVPGGWDCRSSYRCCPASPSQPGVGWCYPDNGAPC